MSTYVRDFISPLYYGNYKCISYIWAPTFWDAADAVWKFNKEAVQPSAGLMTIMTIGQPPSFTF